MMDGAERLSSHRRVDYSHFSRPRLNEVLHDVNISYICCAAVTISQDSPLSVRQLQRKRHRKIELCVRLMLCDFSNLITLSKIGEVHFFLFGTNGFQS